MYIQDLPRYAQAKPEQLTTNIMAAASVEEVMAVAWPTVDT
jgi:hypothetical protein